MSMLAERKRKQKWSLNPKGDNWSQDTSKFGQKLLEKMGWKSGKGLGLKEDGITEHIKVAYKSDSKGVGFKENGEQWTEHEDNFSQLLKNLGGDEGVEIGSPKILNKLEEKSQNSRRRVHYHKFTRGKDLSRYSEKDLANIFGRKSLKKEVKVEEKIGDDFDKNFGVQTFVRGNMNEYFKNKSPKNLEIGVCNGVKVGKNGVLEKVKFEGTILNDESEILEQEICGLSFEQENPYEVKRKSKKRKAKNEGIILNDESEILEQENSVLNNCNLQEENPHEIKRKRKKNKLEKSGIDINEESQILDEEILVQNVNDLQEINPYEIKRKIKKNKSKKEGINLNEEINILDQEICYQNELILEENPYEIKREKKKKNKKSKGLENANDSLSETNLDKQTNKNTIKNQDLSLPIEDDNLMLNICSIPTTPKTDLTPKKSSIKRRKSVRFNNVREERIIPNNNDQERSELFDINTKVILQNFKDKNIPINDEILSINNKVDKINFYDPKKLELEENFAKMDDRIDSIEAEIENDLNNAKEVCIEDVFVGETGESFEYHQKLNCGNTRLSFRHAKFGKTAGFLYRHSSGPKKTYKHLITGDVIVNFKNSNLHEIHGYGENK